MGTIRKFWGWIVGGLAAALALVGLGALVRGRGRGEAPSTDLLNDRAARAEAAAQDKLDQAVSRGVDAVERADREAREAVDNGTGTLADYLLERDPGNGNGEPPEGD